MFTTSIIKYDKDRDLPSPQQDLHIPFEMFDGCICLASFSVSHLYFFSLEKLYQLNSINIFR